MTEQEILQKEKELLKRERELLEREKEMFKAEVAYYRKVETAEREEQAEQAEQEVDANKNININENEYLEIDKIDNTENLDDSTINEILIQSKKEYNDIVPDTKKKSPLTIILLCAILILLGLTVSTLLKTKELTNTSDTISGTIDAVFDTNSGKVITSYQRLD